ncbi:raffinose synthase protein-like protein Sip1 [Lineolata rhizophorae]|uniref:Raffinose synthase protein-like protein Sip1 n=1 Tax=Lineolata rhizophorae TaxID=578093 RepID=A0A6A6NSB9_9PEZI|nr:raffinose synthase protein-like protein Sip1 [Lineolata rhizophorae]
MHAKLVCYPPLGQATVVPSDQDHVDFTVLLETDAASKKTWDVSLWHNHSAPPSSTWTETVLAPLPASVSPTAPNLNGDPAGVLLLSNAAGEAAPPNARRHWFAASLPNRPPPGIPVSFTVKFRAREPDSDPGAGPGASGWKWVRDATGVADGSLYYQPRPAAPSPSSSLDPASTASTLFPSKEFAYYLSDPSPDVAVTPALSQAPHTLLWRCAFAVPAARDPDPGTRAASLGVPTALGRWMALVRLWSPWLAPRHGRAGAPFAPDKEAVLAAFLREDGLSVAALAVSGVRDVLVTMGGEQGRVVATAANDRVGEGEALVLVSVGRSFEEANAAVWYEARKAVMGWEVEEKEKAGAGEEGGGEVDAKWLQNWYDGLTYCTWNGLGQDLTEEKVLTALDELEKSGVSITNLIIDDNWQSLDHPGENQFARGWLEFEANKEGFPHGLSHTVSKVRGRHKSVSHVAVWHALLGYWGGISPDGAIAKEYKTIEVEKKPGVAAGKMLVVDEQDVARFYRDFYSFLSSAGVDSVKTDAQFFLDEIVSSEHRRRLTNSYLDAWSVAQLRAFSAKAISCMSQSPQILFHSQLPTNKPQLCVRNSDDFFPDQPASHPWHVFCNAHNALAAQHLNVLPDWDMFQTSHEWAGFHAAARCVSGGPVYITDEPAKHNMDLIHQMTAPTMAGQTVILRPPVVARTTMPYAAYDDRTLLKVASYVGFARTGTPILAVFNVSGRALTELIPLADFPGAEGPGRSDGQGAGEASREERDTMGVHAQQGVLGAYVVAAHRSGKVSAPMLVGARIAFVCLELGVAEWDILTAVPVREFELGKGGGEEKRPVKVANLGLLGKMTGAAAVVNTDVYVEDNGRLRVWTSLKALGTWGLYVSDLPRRSLDDDFMGLIFGNPIPRDCVKKGATDPMVLEVDVENAFKESGTRPGWSNETAVEIFIS